MLLAAVFSAGKLGAQIIEFESGGLNYATLTRGGVTIMWAPLPIHIRGYAILQVTITNGSEVPQQIKPEDFQFEKTGGPDMVALSASTVVGELMKHASRGDVIKLTTAYETVLEGNTRIHSTNGYEIRRQNAQAELGSGKLRAAAAASAIALAATKLMPGQTTDGAIFYPNGGRPLGEGKLVVNTAGEVFEFPVKH